jgi:lipoprotein-releasing system permease protein
MKISLFVSFRYILSNKDSRLLNLISLISIVGIALGVATLIIALSVLRGFENTLSQKIMDFDSHIKIRSFTNLLPESEKFIDNLLLKFPDQFSYISPSASNLAIISKKNRKEGINIKGILEGEELIRIKNNLVSGELNLTEPISLVLGKTLATKLLVNPGDKVTLFALQNNKTPSLYDIPNIIQFQVTGIFESGMADYDNLIGYTNLKDAQNLFSMPDEINGIDIKLISVSNIDSITNEIRKFVRYPYRANSIYELHRNIFTWIELQKKPIPIVLGLIILVAVFNIISALLMLVLEKTNAIGILKSLGAKRNEIIKIFLYQGIYLSLIGILSGNIISWLLMSIQLKYNIITVPSSVYFVTKVPIILSLDIFVMISAVTFALTILAAIIPSYFASKINPVTALRFE